MRPLVHMGTAGLSYHATPKDVFDLSGDYFRRRPSRDATSTIVLRSDAGAILSDYDRLQTGYELEREAGVTAAFRHDFTRQHHQLRIDASNLGYTGTRSVVSWSGTGNVNLTPWKATMFERNSNYRSTRLTPQGDARPSFVLNVGARRNLYEDQP